jgi:hypothetical protein
LAGARLRVLGGSAGFLAALLDAGETAGELAPLEEWESAVELLPLSTPSFLLESTSAANSTDFFFSSAARLVVFSESSTAWKEVKVSSNDDTATGDDSATVRSAILLRHARKESKS